MSTYSPTVRSLPYPVQDKPSSVIPVFPRILRERSVFCKMKFPYSPVQFLHFLCTRWLAFSPMPQHRQAADEVQRAGLTGAYSSGQDMALLLEMCILTRLQKAMLSQSFDDLLWRCLCGMYRDCIEWTFPHEARSRRTNPHVERILCCLAVAKAVFWLMKYGKTRRGAEILRLLGRDEARAFSSPDVHSVAKFLDLQKSAFQPAANNDFCMYQWFSPHFRYTGIASIHRKSARYTAGPTKRLHEHLLATCHRHAKDADKLRYRMARRQPADLSMFLVVQRGPETHIRAYEWFDIISHRPKANGSRIRPQKKCRRARPLPQFRARASPQVFVGHEAERRLDKYRQKFEAHKSHADISDAGVPGASFHCSYTTAVRAVFAQTGCFGPLDIFCPCHRELLAKWVVAARGCIDWRAFEERWRTDCAAPKIAGLRSSLHKPGQCRVLRKRLCEYLKFKKLPTKPFRVLSPDDSCAGPLRQVLVAAINRSAAWNQAEKQWLRSQIRVQPGRAETFKSKWNHVATARNTSTNTIMQTSEEFQLSVLDGTVLHKLEKNWDVQYRPNVAEKVTWTIKAADEAWTNAGCQHFPSRALREDVCRSVQKSMRLSRTCKRQQKSSTAYLEHTKQMRFFLKHAAVVPDDKERTTAWCLAPVAYQLLCILFVLVSDTWYFVQYSRQSANQILFDRVSAVLGVAMCKRFGITPLSQLLPYVYCSIKSKCFWAGHKARRVCEQSGHSCVRKICSYWKWPRRRLWRKIHKGIDLLIKRFSPGAETWGLSDASSRLKSGLSKLRPGARLCACHRCNCHKAPLTVVIADAGQFYEEVSPAAACNAVTEIVLKASRSGWTHVAVHRSCKKQSFLSTRVSPPIGSGFVWFSLREITCAFFAAMCVSLVSVGHLVASLKGLPIGGLLSRAAASAYLASAEQSWLSSAASRHQAGFRSVSGLWSNTMLHLRYIDDVILASRAFCRQCLMDVFPVVYPEVSFKIAPTGSSQTWLDMQIDCVTGDIAPKPRKPCTPPPWATSKQYIRPLILGAMLRATAVSTSPRAVRVFMLRFLAGLREAGWSKRVICHALFTVHRDHLLPLLRFLRKVVRSEGFQRLLR